MKAFIVLFVLLPVIYCEPPPVEWQQGYENSGLHSSGYSGYTPKTKQYAAPQYNDDDLSEPANYGFEYTVDDTQHGTNFGHRESRQGNLANGGYFVVLPDGRKQIVEYEADEHGYRPKITYEEGYPKYNGGSATGSYGNSNEGNYGNIQSSHKGYSY